MKKIILDIIKKSKKELIIKTITSFFVRGLLLIIPIYWSKVISNLTSTNIEKSYYLVLLVLLLSILYYGWEYVNQRAWYTFYNKLYKEYNDIVTKNNNNFNDLSLAEFTNIVNNDIDIICTFIGNGVTRIIQILEFIFIYSYFLSINVYIFIVTIVISIIMIMLLFVSGKNVQDSNMKRKSTLDKKTIMAHRIFDTKNKNDKVARIEEYNEQTNNYLNSNYKYNILVTGITYVILASIEVVRYGIIFYGIYLVGNSKMEVGDIVLIYTYYAKILTNFEMLGTISADYRSFKVSVRRLNRLRQKEEKA